MTATTTDAIQIPNNWTPRRYQRPLWRYLESGGKRAAVVAHRRWGKDDIGLHWAATSIVEKPATYWHMLPAYSQARKAIWTAVNPHTGQRRIDEAFPKAIRANTNDQEMFIRFKNGATWQVVGSDNFNALVGSPPYGLVFSEWSLADPAAWAYLSPILQENGGWALFIYTARGRNHGWSLYQAAQQEEDWFALLQTADDTGIFTQGQLDAARAEYIAIYGEDEGEAVFEQEYYCSFDAAIMGAYYGKEMMRAEREERIARVPHDPSYPVDTAWDLGLDDATAIWFIQQIGYEIRVIDYYEVNNQSMKDTIQYILKEKPYNYRAHYMPHDIRNREFSTGQSRLETAMALGLRNVVPGIQQRVEDGINAARNLLPKCVFDARSCARGLDCLRQYRREWDDKARTYKRQPLHDWCFTGDTKILTSYGMRQIKDLPETGKVLTSCGWKPYHSPRVTRIDARLVEVAFKDGLTVKCTPDHMFATASGWKCAKDLRPNTPILSTLTPSRYISMAAYTVAGPAIDIGRAVARNCIGMSGRVLSAISHAIATSITGTATQTTTRSLTLSACHRPNTCHSHGTRGAKTGLISRIMHGQKLLSGTSPKKAAYGTVGTPNGLRAGRNGRENRSRASSAVLRSWHWFAKAVSRRSSAQRFASPRHITSVRWLPERADVWCLTVPGSESFSLSNGAIVHNCSHGADAFRELAVNLLPIQLEWEEEEFESPAQLGRSGVTGY